MNWAAIDFIKEFEGCRLTAYQDQGGVWTIGWGATGSDIIKGTVWTQDQADKDLVQKVQKLETQLSLVFTRDNLSQNKLTAVTDFCYNLGFTAFHGSTLFQLINKSDDLSSAKAMTAWDHIGKVENKGLLIRRFSEGLLYLKDH